MVKPQKSRKNRANSRSLKPRENPRPKRTLVRDSDCVEDVLNDLFDEIIKESKEAFDDVFGEYSTVGEMLGLFDVDKDDHIAIDINRLVNDNVQSVTSPDFQIWSPTPDPSGFDDAEYFLNFLTPFEEEEKKR